MALPKSAIARGLRWAGVGKGEWVMSKTITDKTPASAARPKVTNHGDICGASGVPTARRVMGSVSAKMMTPRMPSHSPSRALWCEGVCKAVFMRRRSLKRGHPRRSRHQHTGHEAVEPAQAKT